MKSTHAQAGSEIRKLLKQNFPTTKFKVTSESYSMGSSVRIEWTDGPTTSQVDELVKQFQYGHFDGMQDIYEYSNSRDDIPQVKYVQTTRNLSEEFRWAISKAKGMYRKTGDLGSNEEVAIRREAQKIDWSDKGHIETAEEEFERREQEYKEWEKNPQGQEMAKMVAGLKHPKAITKITEMTE
jgi:hypothetical protein